ncbi:MAG: hypothetical protein VX910_07875 [Candidatus Latescibacterota bacterium]|nr:hypothetical protein [Candidatus Latescibacterota bacterium]
MKYRIEEVSKLDWMIVSEFLLLVATQFHLEYYDDDHRAGRKMI